MTDRELMQQVLDALEEVNSTGYRSCWKGAFDAEFELLRARLSQPEPEPVAYAKPDDLVNDGYGHVFTVWSSEPATIDTTPLYTAPPQREQIVYCGCGDGIVPDDGAECGTCVSMRQREWQGLTEAERMDILDAELTTQSTEHFALAQTIEAKLKEKNT